MESPFQRQTILQLGTTYSDYDFSFTGRRILSSGLFAESKIGILGVR